MKVCVASGKGGTGKTTVAVNLALAVAGTGEPVHLIDCDVEEPNAHLFVKPAWNADRSAFRPAPWVIEDRCSHCGACSDACRFHAILVSPEKVFILKELCHSCGACVEVCAEGAMRERPRKIGVIQEGDKSGVHLTHGRLRPGEAMAPPLIRQVKRLAREDRIVILDCPPGTSCSVVESVKGCDFCILVAEPTPFGLNDLSIAADMIGQIGVPAGVVINRSDMGTSEVDEFCLKARIPILARLPHDDDLARSYARGIPVSAVSTGWGKRFQGIWETVTETVGKGAGRPDCQAGGPVERQVAGC